MAQRVQPYGGAGDEDFNPFVQDRGGRGGGRTPDRMFTFKSDYGYDQQNNNSSPWNDPWNAAPWTPGSGGGDDQTPKLVDTSFDSSLEYSAESLFSSDHPRQPTTPSRKSKEVSFDDDNNKDDPFDGQAFGDFKVFPTETPSNLFPKKQTQIAVKIEERLTIFLEDTDSAPICRVIGGIYVNPSTMATTSNVRSFCLTIRDRKANVERWEERPEICKNITATLTHLALDSSDQVYRVALRPASNSEAPIVAYRCDPNLKPLPVLIKTKVQKKHQRCRVGIRLRANPNNAYRLKNVAIVTVVPPDINGDDVAISRKGGVWDSMKRTLSWTIPELPPGEVIDIQAQFPCVKSAYSTFSPKFPILVRCSGNTVFSKIHLNTDYTEDGSSPVNLQVEKTANVVYRKV